MLPSPHTLNATRAPLSGSGKVMRGQSLARTVFLSPAHSEGIDEEPLARVRALQPFDAPIVVSVRAEAVLPAPNQPALFSRIIALRKGRPEGRPFCSSGR